MQERNADMTDVERGAVERAVTDYFDSWFEGDPKRMRAVMHPGLAIGVLPMPARS